MNDITASLIKLIRNHESLEKQSNTFLEKIASIVEWVNETPKNINELKFTNY